MEGKKWYVRNTAGKVFGPIDLESLKSWVKDGRVEPLAGGSCDLTHWVIAPLKPELEMNWVVENNPGQFYGPTHRAVMDDLVKTGTLSPAARFYQDDRGAALERIRRPSRRRRSFPGRRISSSRPDRRPCASATTAFRRRSPS